MSYDFVVCGTKQKHLVDYFEDLKNKIAGLKKNGCASLILEEQPDTFVAVFEDSNNEVSVSFSYGGSIREFESAYRIALLMAWHFHGEIYDPQLDRTISCTDSEDCFQKWYSANRAVLKTYADGFHFVRQVIEKESVRIMLEAQRFQRKTAENWSSVGVAYSRIRSFKRALKCFERARRMAPKDPDIIYSLGLTHMLLNDRSRALRFLDQVLLLDPDHEASKALLRDMSR